MRLAMPNTCLKSGGPGAPEPRRYCDKVLYGFKGAPSARRAWRPLAANSEGRARAVEGMSGQGDPP